MNITRRLATFALTAAAVMACGVPTTSAGDLHGFTSDKKLNLFGYYMPTKPVRFGKFLLNNFSVAEPLDFRKFEAGGYKGMPYASLFFNFDDTTSPKKQGEAEEYYANAPRVLPSAYKLAGTTVTFIGADKQVGTVVFTGTFDPPVIKAAQAGGSTEKVALHGDLTVGGKTLKNVTFTWFGGD